MYDDDEQRRKRKRILWGTVIAIILLIIIIILLLTSCGGNKKPVEQPQELACKLKVTSGTKDANGKYTSDVVIEFESKTPTSEDIPIERYGIGKNKNYSGNDTYKISGVSGVQKINGYIKDSAGNEASCSIEVDMNAASSTCSLKVLEGTAGENNWYKSNVIVGFDTKEASSESATITEYRLATSKDELTATGISKDNIDKLTISNDGENYVYGYVKDSEGNEGTCELAVNKDATKPTCSLKVTSGKLSNGVYTGNVVVSFDKTQDKTSGLSSYGIGTKENYDEKDSFTYTSTANGYVYGYIKDKAGNEGTCKIQIKRTSGSGGTTTTSTPACVLQISSGTQGTNGWYKDNITVTFKSKTTTNGATITSYGIGTTKNYDRKSKITVTKDGKNVIYGYVKDSNGNESICKINAYKDSVAPTCSITVTNGNDGYDETKAAYTTAVTVSFKSKADATSGIDSFGIGTSKAYNNNESVTISTSGTHTIYASVKDKAGNEAICNAKVVVDIAAQSQTLISAGVQVGDYVKYDAGYWDATVSIPTKNQPNTFGGYVSGKNRGNGVTCEGGGTAQNGWRVLSVSNGVIKIVSAGMTECYYFPLNGNSSTAQTTLRNRGSVYVNSDFATSGTVLTSDMIDSSMTQLKNYSNSLYNIGTAYYLGSSSDSKTLWGISSSGTAYYYSARAYGIRPVITLKQGVKTSGKTSSGWVLVK